MPIECEMALDECLDCVNLGACLTCKRWYYEFKFPDLYSNKSETDTISQTIVQSACAIIETMAFLKQGPEDDPGYYEREAKQIMKKYGLIKGEKA
jgi:hypothetical protein